MEHLYAETREAVFLSRPNRFVARVLLAGEEVVCHVKNTGRCKELLLPGARVILAKGENPLRKTAWDLVAVYKGENLVNIDSQAPNKAALAWLKGQYPEARIRSEVSIGRSRLDFLMEQGGRKLYVEVKGVTLENNGLALFPDAPTPRGTRHLEELAALAGEGHQALALFIIQMGGISSFSPHEAMDPAFAKALRRSFAAGVRVEALTCQVWPRGMKAQDPVPVQLFPGGPA